MANVTRVCRVRQRWVSLAPRLVALLVVSGCGSDSNGDEGTGGTASAGNGPTATAGSSGSGGSSGAAGSAGASGASGTGGSGAAGGSEGQPDIGGISGASGSSGTAGTAGEPAQTDTRPFFSFFVTSQAGLFGLPAGTAAPAPDPVDGFGGNLGGLAGADEICTALARQANPGDQKTWRAFLSTSAFGGATPVDAIDRIGEGPWYNFNGLLFAEDVEGLLPQGNNGRPRDADPELAAMFTDENGDDVRPSQQVDNHDTLTGSGQDGRLFDDGEDGAVATCENWTSSTLQGNSGNLMGAGGQIPVGHSWPRSNNNGRHWINDHTINGCEPGADIDGGAGAPAGDFRVGAGGGYGGFYCFALGAVAPD